jgi:hypothetical protein
MANTQRSAWRRSLMSTASRRGVLTALCSGLLAAGPLAPLAIHTDARGDRQKRKRKRRDKRRKGKNRRQPPVVRADARCIGNSDVDFGVVENGREAQTFTALSSGALVRAELTIAKDENALDDWILRISPTDATGSPMNTVLAETFVPDASVPLGAATAVTFDFAKPAAVIAGVTYALVLTRGEFFRWAGRDGDPCSGQTFASSNQTAPFDRIDLDHVFSTFVAS